nr:hypothetical protein [Tanacetum cinerariifolium]
LEQSEELVNKVKECRRNTVKEELFKLLKANSPIDEKDIFLAAPEMVKLLIKKDLPSTKEYLRARHLTDEDMDLVGEFAVDLEREMQMGCHLAILRHPLIALFCQLGLGGRGTWEVRVRCGSDLEIPEVDLPLRKRLCTAHTGTYELGESSVAAAARLREPEIPEVDLPLRKRLCTAHTGESSVAAAARLREPVRDDLYRAIQETTPTTVEGVNQRVTEISTTFDRETSMIYAMIEEKQDDQALHWEF